MQDLNFDARADIAFQHDSGAVVVWVVDPSTLNQRAFLVDINPGPWQTMHGWC